jgi:3-hydroxybutyrate dehydrogenase
MLNGRSAVVTGSTSGIGLGISRALAAQGCDVLLNGFGDAAQIESARRAIEEESGVRVLYHAADLTRPDQVARLITAAVDEFGGVDILCNNAGIQHTAPVDRFPTDMWNSILATNLSAAFHAIRLALPHMKEKGWGRIVNTASVHGLVASAEKAAYVAAKHGLIGLTKVVALETAQLGITCNAFCPGWVNTPLVEGQMQARARQLGVDLEEGKRSLLLEKQPSGLFVEIEHIGALVVFLCSEAAAHITGAAIPIDGGWTAQ